MVFIYKIMINATENSLLDNDSFLDNDTLSKNNKNNSNMIEENEKKEEQEVKVKNYYTKLIISWRKHNYMIYAESFIIILIKD